MKISKHQRLTHSAKLNQALHTILIIFFKDNPTLNKNLLYNQYHPSYPNNFPVFIMTKTQETPKKVPQEVAKETLEDDDFEEFPAEDWQTKEESFPVWEDNWDDDDIEEDFCQQLIQQKAVTQMKQ